MSLLHGMGTSFRIPIAMVRTIMAAGFSGNALSPSGERVPGRVPLGRSLPVQTLYF